MTGIGRIIKQFMFAESNFIADSHLLQISGALRDSLSTNLIHWVAELKFRDKLYPHFSSIWSVPSPKCLKNDIFYIIFNFMKIKTILPLFSLKQVTGGWLYQYLTAALGAA